MPVDEILARFDRPPSLVVANKLLGMAAGNSVADWTLSDLMAHGFA